MFSRLYGRVSHKSDVYSYRMLVLEMIGARNKETEENPCPSNRPAMNRVVEMMEGSLGAIEVPPKPSMQISRNPLPDSSCLSEVNSNNSEELI
ncbi:hypothetical protein F2Q70_00013832 [Brassica cretica]|uniref:Serine-threonine/tyrosine-protein kinase catalytic domain-containing protein n=1 Tax=Brassica cretica TaxID=69181 RepID=A0A8S9M4Y3_BRACR|nr:hypothetical protein F2Q70_00013832 [Brassica cretica]